MSFLSLILYALSVWGLFLLFEKGGVEGWKAIIPVYNVIVFLNLINRPWYRILIYLVPLVNIIVFILDCMAFAKSYGQDPMMGVGIFFLPFVFLPLIALKMNPVYVGTKRVA